MADLNNAAAWIVSTCPLISKSSSPFTNPLGIVQSAPITIGITVTFIFHSFFKFSSKVWIYSLSFNFTQWSTRMAKSTIRQLLCFCCWQSFDLVIWLRLGDLFVSWNPRELCASHSTEWIPGWVYATCSYGQISISCTIPYGSPFPTVVSSLILVLCKFVAFAFYMFDRFVIFIIIFAHWEFFTSVLVDGFSLEFGLQQVSSSLQDSSQYSGRSQKCSSLDGLYSSANFQVLQSL